jgi:hypothetical protein
LDVFNQEQSLYFLSDMSTYNNCHKALSYTFNKTDVHPPMYLLTLSGALPDQIEFSKNCRTLLVSNEGEPNSYGQADSVDPEGSVSIISLRYCPHPSLRGPCGGQTVSGTIRTATFTDWNDRRDALIAQGIKISPEADTVAQDFEPEYTTFSEDESLAFVALQVGGRLGL